MKLQTKKVFYVGLAFLIICMFWQVYDNIIAKMLINTFGLNQAISGIVMALDNVLALFLLPVFGALSDKTKTKYGKRVPYIFIGVIASAVFFIGVSVFDDLQMNKLKEEDANFVVTINSAIFDEGNEYHYMVDSLSSTDKEKLEAYHTGDFWYPNNISKDKIVELFDLNKNFLSPSDLDKYFCFTDIELSEVQFLELCDKYLSDSEKSEYQMLLNLSHDERVKPVIIKEQGFLDQIFNKEPISSGSRVHQQQLNKLNKLLAHNIYNHFSSNDDNEGMNHLLGDIGVREFYTVKENATQVRGRLVWEYTKGNVFYLVGFLIILLITLVAMASFRTPAVSLMPDVTIKPLRSKANAVINLMGTVGGVLSLLLMSFLAKDYHSYMLLFIVIGFLMILLLIFFMRTVNENKLVNERIELEKEYAIEEVETVNTENVEDMPKDVRKSFYLIMISIIFWFMAYNAATTKFSVYAGDVLNMGYTVPLLVANITAIICYIPIGIIASKIGRKKTILAGILILFFAFLMGSIARENTKILIYVTMGVAGIGWATINVNSYPMIVEMSKNSNVGKYTGYYYTASMFAQILTPVLSGLLMDVCNTMTVLFPYSVVFCVLAFGTMLFVKHGDSKPIANKTIEAFDIDD